MNYRQLYDCLMVSNFRLIIVYYSYNILHLKKITDKK